MHMCAKQKKWEPIMSEKRCAKRQIERAAKPPAGMVTRAREGQRSRVSGSP
jgi:hypothetical protein